MKITTMLLKASDKLFLVFYKVSHFIRYNESISVQAEALMRMTDIRYIYGKTMKTYRI